MCQRLEQCPWVERWNESRADMMRLLIRVEALFWENELYFSIQISLSVYHCLVYSFDVQHLVEQSVMSKSAGFLVFIRIVYSFRRFIFPPWKVQYDIIKEFIFSNLEYDVLLGSTFNLSSWRNICEFYMASGK